jgi:hypothetical protein
VRVGDVNNLRTTGRGGVSFREAEMEGDARVAASEAGRECLRAGVVGRGEEGEKYDGEGGDGAGG